MSINKNTKSELFLTEEDLGIKALMRKYSPYFTVTKEIKIYQGYLASIETMLKRFAETKNTKLVPNIVRITSDSYRLDFQGFFPNKFSIIVQQTIVSSSHKCYKCGAFIKNKRSDLCICD